MPELDGQDPFQSGRLCQTRKTPTLVFYYF
jgi:hypothetical protein